MQTFESHSFINPSTPQGIYLPAYLMGDIPNSTMSSPKSHLMAVSPTKAQYGSSPWKYTQITEPFVSQTPKSEHKNRVKEKPGAPPVQGLLEFMSSPAGNVRPVWQTTPDVSQRFPSSVEVSSYQIETMHTSPMKVSPLPAQPITPSPYHRQLSESEQQLQNIEDYCVTVFGFQPNAASFILQQFTQFGTVIDHQIASAGNWMHLYYQTAHQAKVALSRNGRLFGSVMVGVAPCSDKEFIAKCQTAQTRQSLREESVLLSRVRTPGDMTANSSLLIDGCSSADIPRTGVKRSMSMRPLTTNYRPSGSNSPIVSADGMIPRKRTSILGKAVEYIFGL